MWALPVIQRIDLLLNDAAMYPIDVDVSDFEVLDDVSDVSDFEV
eukprot:CAMPEP_0174924106 /NCGR_PEP_ID=MMETSP1355-20121228/7033_1 /TAXON_ID=464990 /ORGANISM="Hemiselmis tepida, Strain CCMP443" /LENGTH=43 /DNA_ID= /DNA_START= /DNA_END= /DNA_ORIENTATION=